ncbi:hypothetical protein [Chitinilyticum litopenaei]|uniref:hypothetical protein n=1 Tax=Chitinilyticum litopenaei TaxID=1121276 RepID=UPI0003FF7C92|nr:hypothetical protein [Chitinilyticum litopenaei]
MLSLGLLYCLALLVLTVASVVVLKRRHCLSIAVKGAFGCVGVLLAASFIYGLFNRFGFWHAVSPPGIDSGIGYAILACISAGPPVFIAGGWLAVAGAHAMRNKKARSE